MKDEEEDVEDVDSDVADNQESNEDGTAIDNNETETEN